MHQKLSKIAFVLMIYSTYASSNLFTITDKHGNVMQSKFLKHKDNAYLDQKATEYSLQAIYDELHRAEYLAEKLKLLDKELNV